MPVHYFLFCTTKSNAMRTRSSFPLILFLLLSVMFDSCEKSSDPPEYDPIQVSDQAVLTILGEAIHYSSAGLIFELKELTVLASSLFQHALTADSCGMNFTESLYGAPDPASSFVGYEGNWIWRAYCSESYEVRSVTANTHLEPSYPPGEIHADWLFTAVVSEGIWSLHSATGSTTDFSGSYKRWGYFNQESLSDYLYTLEIRPSMLNTTFPFSLQTFMARFTLTFETKIGQDVVKKVIPGTLEFAEEGKIEVEINEKEYEISLERIG